MTLFIGYCLGMALAILCAIGFRRALSLRIFYAAVIVIAHFAFVPHAFTWGKDFYLACGMAQFSILMAALMFSCFASVPIALAGGVACVVNVLAYYNYPAHTGIWTMYFALINTVQVVQISSLIFLSPLGLCVARWYANKTKRGELPWMERTLQSLEM